MSTSTERVQAILAGAEPLPAAGQPLDELVAELHREQEFGPVRRLLERCRARDGDGEALLLALALATYKDEELVPGLRFKAALDLLDLIGLRDPANLNRSTLGCGGAIYKRMWQHGGRLEDLHTSLAFYTATWRRGPPLAPDGDAVAVDKRLYGAVNAIFVLDQLAARARVIARTSGTERALADELTQRAAVLRAEALPWADARYRQVLADETRGGTPSGREREARYWVRLTLAELHFGAGRWDDAHRVLDEASRLLAPDSWQVQSAASQLIAQARALEAVPPPPHEGSPPAGWHAAWRAIAALFGPRAGQAVQSYRGKVGLALSGGGFRASLFHLGVLARLAEMDVLRSVEVLSTVSGGSIVGAHYYLEVQKLLQSRADAEITRDDYVALVRRVKEAFCAGVQRNMRMRTLTSLGASLKMAFSRRYTRSNRLGELYEAHFYDGVDRRPPGRGRPMHELLIAPAGEPAPFKPRLHNWRRRTKVPVLLLNATSLNSGHNWQFTGRWMGEPPDTFDAGVDMNDRYRRLWYEQAPDERLRHWPLGHAVAASACVPGLFEPLVLEGLYPGRTVRLVDGGVHDNQGAEGLLSEGCTLILCSDASGQMDDLTRPPDNRLGVPLRANGILMDRVREAQYQDLRARVTSRSLQGLFFVHMKQGLDVGALDWTGCDDPAPVPAQALATTAYGIDKTLQRQLAALRTDLDAFSELESELLMLSGYLMTAHQFRELQRVHERSGEGGTWGGFEVAAPRGDWSFLRLETLARQPPDSADQRRREIGRQIGLGALLFFRVWFLAPVLRALAVTSGLAAAVALVWWLAVHRDDRWQLLWTSAPVWQLALGAVLLAAGMLVPLLRWLQPASAMRGVLAKLGVAVAGWVIGQVQLHVFDRWFLRIGRVARVMRLP